MDESAHMNENAGPYKGLDRFEARKRVVADLEAQGFLAGVKDYVISLGKCDRCKTIVEPRISTQWFVRIKPLANRAIEVVEKGYIRFTPENYRTIYLNWMYNIYDWCISRQLWWGHRIPAWHCQNCKEINVACEAPQKCQNCGSTDLKQDTDVLDTWFSSALLPFTTLGWPSPDEERKRGMSIFYPTSLLITGFDILFFWVARMIMMGCWFMGDEDKLDSNTPAGQERLKNCVPFREVYIHALVRDAERQKMSKTKGNVIDPIEITEKYGTDAVRFTLASMASPGTDIAFSPERTEGYRAFANKIWNAARFIFMNVDRAQESGIWTLAEFKSAYTIAKTSDSRTNGSASEPLEDRWIRTRFAQTVEQINQALTAYRFHEAANLVYALFWGEFCDWYLEIIKLRLDFGNAEHRDRTRVALIHLLQTFEASLRLLSPFMPFITEEIWQAIYDGKPPLKSIALAEFPRVDNVPRDEEGVREMEILQALIKDVRNRRKELEVPEKVKTPIQIHTNSAGQRLFHDNRYVIEKLANVEGIRFEEHSIAKLPGIRAAESYEVGVIFEKKIDVAAERERLNKELKKLETELANAQRQLGNENFLSKAPTNVVEGLRKRKGELEALIPKTRSSLDELANM
jgi:valyl-tRNA synthetase